MASGLRPKGQGLGVRRLGADCVGRATMTENGRWCGRGLAAMHCSGR